MMVTTSQSLLYVSKGFVSWHAETTDVNILQGGTFSWGKTIQEMDVTMPFC